MLSLHLKKYLLRVLRKIYKFFYPQMRMVNGISREELEIAKNVAIATTTFYRLETEEGRVRSEIAERTVRSALERGYDVSVVDGGSPDKFLRTLEDLGARVLKEVGGGGLGPGRRQALQSAYDSGREVVGWTEPEKVYYIQELWKTAIPIIAEGVDLVVPARRSLEDYPTDQQHAEHFGNIFFKNLTGHALDMWFGPRTFSGEVSDYFLNYDGKYGDLWDAHHIPVLDMIHDGKRVLSVLIDYRHPTEQTKNEEGDPEFGMKRYKQLENLVPTMYKHWKMLNSSKQ